MEAIIEADSKKKILHKHRIGSITFGCTLIMTGILFLLHAFIPAITYDIIFHLWPCIMILLGVEILIANQKDNQEFLYDGTAIFLIFVLCFFAMGMAFMDVAMHQVAQSHIY